jgi:signal transduction histidine kinase
VLDGKAARCDFALEGPDGRMIDVSTELVPRRGDAGEIPGYYVLATDISALKEVDRLKSEFVTTVSHELRTPLTSIRGSLGLLAGGVTGPLSDKAKQLVNIATENCGRLVRLVTDILDSEKMLAGKMDMTIETLDIDELVARSMRENDGFAATHGVKLAFDNAAPGTRVNADRDRLVQVITNLLSNAIKFSPQGGTVDVDVRRERDTVRVTVADRGPGVPFEFQSRLFERFAQLDSFDSRRRGGTGLGLSICQGIIERLNGSIAYSPRSGGGSEFYFELPVRA